MKKVLFTLLAAFALTGCMGLAEIFKTAKDAIPTPKNVQVTQDENTVVLSYTLSGGFEGGDMQSSLVWSFADAATLPESLSSLKTLLQGMTEPFCVSAILTETYATQQDAQDAMAEHGDPRAKQTKNKIVTDLSQDFLPSIDDPANIWTRQEILEEANGRKSKLEKASSYLDIFG